MSTDLSIHIRLDRNQGWMIRVAENEGYDSLVPDTEMGPADVREVADLIDRILPDHFRSISVAVDHANREMAKHLASQVAAHRATLRRLEDAQAALSAFQEAGE